MTDHLGLGPGFRIAVHQSSPRGPVAGSTPVAHDRPRTQQRRGTLVPMAAKDALGRRGEDLAAAHLTRAGLRIIDRNWRCGQGEIDIVARDGGETVFVEVKTRSGVGYGHPLESITAAKLARLRRLAAAWCEAHTGPHDRIRVDAIAVIAPSHGPVVIEHLERVF
jgi:putative endonuclease